MKMKAIYIERHGSVADLKISEIPVPAPKTGEVLVKIEAAGINPSDVVSVEGHFDSSVLPRVVGRDFAGRIAEGPSDLVGRRVWGSGGDLGVTRDGTNAEYLVIPQSAVVPRPKNLTAEEAAAVGVPFITAYSALFRLGRLNTGEWVVISGAAGSVGQAAIQLAHAKGARIIALVRDASELRSGPRDSVAAVADSTSGNLNSVVQEETQRRGADLALNGVGGSVFGALLTSLARYGRMVVYSAADGKQFPLDLLSFYRSQISLFGLDTQQLDATACGGILKEIVPLFESNAVKPPAIAQRFPFSRAVEGYEYVAARKGGKVVLVFD